MRIRKDNNIGKRYSEAYKTEIVRRWENGDYETLAQLLRVNGIINGRTVKKWIAKYGNINSVPKTIRIETVSEKNELQEAKKEIKALQAALSEMTMRNLLGESYLEIACEEIGTEVEKFKKKRVIELSKVPHGKVKRRTKNKYKKVV